jgi:hypothetical protein
MSTRTLVFTAEELQALSILVNNAEHDADQRRMLTRPDSPQEKAAAADQAQLQTIMAKLAGRAL